MKKFSLIISVLALVMGLSQCQKRPNAPVLGGITPSTKTITFTTNGGGGAKGDFEQVSEVLNYKWDMNNDKDVIHVYVQPDGEGFTDGEYLGTMEMVSVTPDKLSATFQGTFTYDFPNEGWIRFVHFGHSVEVENGGTKGTVDFSIQNGSLETISDNVVAVCDKPLNSTMSYNECTLEVQFAVIYVNLTNLQATDDVKMLNIASTGLNVSTNGAVTYNTKSDVNLGKENLGNYYLVVMPENAKAHHTFFDEINNEKIGCLEGKAVKGFFYSDGVNPLEVKILPKGSLPGAFSTSDGNAVHFSKGNLQYLPKESAESDKWRFAERQWDFMGDAACPGNVTLSGYEKYNSTDEDQNAARDLFGWGTTGYQDNRENAYAYQVNYQPYSTKIEKSENAHNWWGYGPDYYEESKYNLSVNSHSDWGFLLGEETGWRTLTIDEWAYIMRDRTTNVVDIQSNAHYALAKVNGVFGLIVFPDVFTWPAVVEPKPSVFDDDLNSAQWEGAVEYNEDSFKLLEDEGVVFLPCTGQRGSCVEDVYTYGLYWSSSAVNEKNNSLDIEELAYSFGFCGEVVNMRNDALRYLGRSVRLVR